MLHLGDVEAALAKNTAKKYLWINIVYAVQIQDIILSMLQFKLKTVLISFTSVVVLFVLCFGVLKKKKKKKNVLLAPYVCFNIFS